MTPHRRLLAHPWLLVVGVVVLIVVHGLMFRAALQTAWPIMVVVAAIIIIVLKHLGLFALLYNRLRRRSS